MKNTKTYIDREWNYCFNVGDKVIIADDLPTEYISNHHNEKERPPSKFVSTDFGYRIETKLLEGKIGTVTEIECDMHAFSHGSLYYATVKFEDINGHKTVFIKSQARNFFEHDDVFESPYCPICESCGEDGCCPAIVCKQHPDGYYCETNLLELKFGYLMYDDIYNLVSDDPKYKDKITKIFNKNWDSIFYNVNKITE